MCRGAYILYFKINAPIFCRPHLSENDLNPQFRINKIVNKKTVDYHPSPSKLTSRIHPLIFLLTPKGFISPEFFLNFFLNLYIPTWLRKSFKFMVLRLLANTFVSQKIEFVHFTHAPKQNSPLGFYHYPQAEGNYPYLQNSVFGRSIFFPAERGEDHGIEKITKIKPTRVASFDKFHHLCNLYIFGFVFYCTII